MSTAHRPTFSEHDSEPVPGLPGPLPQGEAILWQGSPGWRGLARRAMHLRALAIYFAILGAWSAAVLSSEGAGKLAAIQGMGFVLLLGTVPIALLALYAWASARSTLYTITTRRIVVRTGVALPMTINIPFAVIGSAGVAQHADGTGDILLQVMPPNRISWLALWPHTRSFRVLRPQPMLRAVAQPDSVAQILGRALAAAAAVPVQPIGARAPAKAADRPAEAMA
ncbi:photosynthetic complex putative assembly protein PuhB [Roseomonas sp. AR75]|uniref:photosynthetic complex putative assembly protein PuhB n=1 Tax=Roseomonas sp. AR75 TaxID=2562311 RepID=UPI0010C08CB1|nr:photosynthetic complex putative assembly protein PuhB [Roseomonas sp. AR75]